MTKFTISIYRFFQKQQILFYLLFLISSIFFIYFGTKVEYEEDISKLLPSTNDTENSDKLAFANLKVKDKLFVLFSSENKTIEPEYLAEKCDEFISNLLVKDSSEKIISDVLYRIDDNLAQNSIGFLYSNVPLFLDSTDYIKMDSMFTKTNIEKQMSENYMNLFSPAGMAFRDIISQDPIAMRNIFTNKLSSVKEGLGSNYIINDKHFYTPDSAIVIAFISPNFQSFNSKESIRLIEMLDKVITEFKTVNPDIRIDYHGAPAQSVYNSKQIKNDLVMTLTVSLIIICTIILFCFRNISTLPHLLIPVIYGTFFALTGIYFLKGSMSLLAIGIGAIVLGVALSYCLHVLTHYKYVSNPEKVLQDQTVPVILGCLTTIGAFLGLLFTQSELLKDFGIFASLALVGTTFFSLIFLPQFFNPKKNKRSDKAFSFLEKINSYPFEKKTWLIISVIILSLICFVTSKWVTFDADLKNIGYNEEKVIRSQEMLSSRTMPGYITTYYAATSKNQDSALIYNRQMMVLLDSLLQEKEIKNYSKATSLFIPEKEQKRKIERWNNYWTQEKKKEIKQLITESGNSYNFRSETFEPFFQSLDKKYNPVSLYDSGIIPSSILANLIEYTDSTYLVFTPVQLKKEDLSKVSDIIAKDKYFIVVDPFYYTKDMVLIINDDFNVTLFISSIFVFIVLLLSFQSLILSILAFIPMTLSWYIVLGIMGIFGLQFNLINIVIATFIFGIGVDYSIFIMDGLLSGFRTKTQLLTYHKTAIFFSAIVLIIGTASLLFATHPVISSIGISTIIGMSSTIIIAYSLQPFLFYWLIKRPTLRGKAPITIYNILHADNYFGKKGLSDVQKIRNNYEYKGNEIEKAIRKELRETNNYDIFNSYIKENQNVLEYGCQYGFISYWFLLKGKNNQITGFERDNNMIAIAEHCYLKNDNIKFSTQESILENKYDMVIFNHISSNDANIIQHIITTSETIIIRKEILSDIQKIFEFENLSEINSDSLFSIFNKKK